MSEEHLTGCENINHDSGIEYDFEDGVWMRILMNNTWLFNYELKTKFFFLRNVLLRVTKKVEGLKNNFFTLLGSL